MKGTDIFLGTSRIAEITSENGQSVLKIADDVAAEIRQKLIFAIAHRCKPESRLEDVLLIHGFRTVPKDNQQPIN